MRKKLHQLRKVESRRINRLLRDPIADFKLSQLKSTEIAAFRDRRVKDGLRAAQVDLGIIRHLIKIAAQEWGISMPSNQVDGVRVPNGVKRRDRRLLPGEYEALKKAALQFKNLLIWPPAPIRYVSTAPATDCIFNLGSYWLIYNCHCTY